MLNSRTRYALPLTGLFFPLLLAGGCASPVPGQVGGTGKAIEVTMQFAGTPDPGSGYYFFCINRYGVSGDANARGPVAVYAFAQSNGGTGNGFATGSGGSTTGLPGGPAKDYGLTDYVLISSGQSTSPDGNIGLYHVFGTPLNPGDPNIIGKPVLGEPEGAPVSYSLADPQAQDSSATTIRFRINLSQLVSNEEASDATTKAKIAAAIHFLQVNIISTNRVPVSQTPDPTKQVDAMGSPTSISSTQQSSYLTLNLDQTGTTYDSRQQNQSLAPEQSGDVWPPGSNNPNIDLVYWQVRVVNIGG